MSEFEYKIIGKEVFFSLRKHNVRKDFKLFVKGLIEKGVISVNLLKEVNEEMTDILADTIDECATETAEKINKTYGKLIK